jgi:hypothetical protein
MNHSVPYAECVSLVRSELKGLQTGGQIIVKKHHLWQMRFYGITQKPKYQVAKGSDTL